MLAGLSGYLVGGACGLIAGAFIPGVYRMVKAYLARAKADVAAAAKKL